MNPIIILVVIVVIILLILTSCIKIVPQANAMVIERLGVAVLFSTFFRLDLMK